MLRSSVAAQVSRQTLFALVAAPLLYMAAGADSLPLAPARRARSWRGPAAAFVLLVVWVVSGQLVFIQDWTTRRDRQVAGNAQWVFVSSWWHAFVGVGGIGRAGSLSPEDLADFEPLRRALRGPLAQAGEARL